MGKPKLLLHLCCAPCGGFLASALAENFAVAGYYDNSNIYPEEEFLKRKNEAKKFFAESGLELIEADYNHQSWLDLVKGLENEPEKGARCRVCYDYRLRATARCAKDNGFEYFASTLAISPHKDARPINELGQAMAEEFGIKFLASDWKKQDGFKKAMTFSRERGFYHQDYCGCEFSAVARSERKVV